MDQVAKGMETLFPAIGIERLGGEIANLRELVVEIHSLVEAVVHHVAARDAAQIEQITALKEKYKTYFVTEAAKAVVLSQWPEAEVYTHAGAGDRAGVTFYSLDHVGGSECGDWYEKSEAELWTRAATYLKSQQGARV